MAVRMSPAIAAGPTERIWDIGDIVNLTAKWENKPPSNWLGGVVMKTLTLMLSGLFSAALLSSYSSAIAANVRPDVAQPLDEARVIANAYGGTSDKARIEAKLNQAASVPDLNSDERHQIVVVRDYVISRVGQSGHHTGWHDWNANHPPTSMPNYSKSLGYTGLR